MLSKNQIKDLQSLQLKKIRDQKSLFIAEGSKTVLEILEQKPEIIKDLFVTEDFMTKQGEALETLGLSTVLVSQEELRKISLQPSPSGALAICHFLTHFEKEPNPTASISFFLDDIRDPGNLGTIMRLLAWFGHSTVYCSPSSCEVYNPKVIQASMGAFLRVQVVYRELNDLITEKKIKNIYGAVLDGRSLYTEKFSHGLIVIGNEANGISDINLELLSEKITIPAAQANSTESLNAAMATSIIAAEMFRQKLGS
ncbi:MAG: RNA methyltransferase [bacterium]|nr:RNA methyltransferase [bacterium]